MADEAREYWIAHVRGPNYEVLKKKGFLVLYPDVDDYVFLEVKDDNKKYLKKQLELSIAFLKQKSKLVTVKEEEVQRMIDATSREKIEPGTSISVISGYCENLDGIVTGVIDDDQVEATLNGYNRQYDVVVKRLDVVEADAQIAQETTEHPSESVT